jgi:hypothetical protein
MLRIPTLACIPIVLSAFRSNDANHMLGDGGQTCSYLY